MFRLVVRGDHRNHLQGIAQIVRHLGQQSHLFLLKGIRLLRIHIQRTDHLLMHAQGKSSRRTETLQAGGLAPRCKMGIGQAVIVHHTTPLANRHPGRATALHRVVATHIGARQIAIVDPGLGADADAAISLIRETDPRHAIFALIDQNTTSFS